jgi:hypothetical protein
MNIGIFKGITSLFCCTFILYHIFQVLVSSYDFSDEDFWGDAKRWCEYLHETKEPKIILHGRIPRSGEITMQRMLMLRSKNKNEIMTTNTNFWTDYDENYQARKKFISMILHQLKKSNHVIVSGHWKHTYFTEKEFNDTRFENIQLFRDCQGRRHQVLHIALNFSSDMSRKFKEAKLEEYQTLSRRINMNNEYCYNAFYCLKRTNFAEIVGFYPSELYHVCGAKCMEQYGSADVGSYYNIHNPNIFTVIGSLDKFYQFLEMLECAYPTRLQGIRQKMTLVSKKLTSF